VYPSDRCGHRFPRNASASQTSLCGISLVSGLEDLWSAFSTVPSFRASERLLSAGTLRSIPITGISSLLRPRPSSSHFPHFSLSVIVQYSFPDFLPENEEDFSSSDRFFISVLPLIPRRCSLPSSALRENAVFAKKEVARPSELE